MPTEEARKTALASPKHPGYRGGGCVIREASSGNKGVQDSLDREERDGAG